MAPTIEQIEALRPKIHSYLRSRGVRPDQADDLTQVSILRVWMNRAKYDPLRGSLQTFAVTVAGRVHLDDQRYSRARASTVSIEEHIPETDITFVETLEDPSDPFADVLAVAVTPELAWALAQIRRQYRLAVYLRDYEGLSYAAVAERTGVPLDTTRTNIHRGRKKLRALLGEQFFRDRHASLAN